MTYHRHFYFYTALVCP